MLTLSPINSVIQDTLKKKMGMLRKMSGADNENPIGSPLSTTTGDVEKNYMFARTPFLRMTSFSPRNESKEAIVLMGGQLRGGSTDFPMNRLRAGFEDYAADVGSTITGNADDPFINYLGLYTQPDKTIIDDIPYRPTAGLKDISVEYKGGGMRLGATRTAEISWTCWTWQELDNYRPHFLHHGKTILLEWGWSGDGIIWESNTPFYDIFQGNTLKIQEDKIVNLNQGLLDHVLSQKGHYDAMLGLVQDFTWSVNDDGGFDCSTKLISQGITILQKSQRRNAVQTMASLPLLASEDATFMGWLPFKDDTEINFTGDQTVEALAPYISIQEYMSDFPQQLWSYLIKTGPTKEEQLAAHGMKIFSVNQFKWKEVVATEETREMEVIEYGSDDMQHKVMKDVTYISYEGSWEGEKNFGHAQAHHFPELYNVDETKVKHQLTNVFCTWGWFEDNVLSRFFGTVGEVEGLGDKLIGEFRSIEPVLDADSTPVKLTDEDISGEFSDSKVDSQVYESTKMTNSKYLITIDTSKWIIPNEGDPFLSNIVMNDYAGQPLGSGTVKLYHPTKLGVVGAESVKYNLFTSPGPTASTLKTKGSVKTSGLLNPDPGMIRNVYFNANYLKEKFKDTTDIVSSVMSVWEEFSNQYGGVYKFKVDFADDGKRAMVVEEGYTGVSVHDALTDEDKKDKVFEFPVWKSDSIVKSQNISAKVPKRMQLAAMYGSVSQKEEKGEEGVQHSSNQYDDLIAKVWGRYVEDLPSDTTGMSQDQIKQQRYKDMLSGNIDTVNRGNRYFGQAKADPNQELWLGEVKKKEPFAPTADKRGIQIFDSILNELQDIQKQELFDLVKELADANVNDDGTRTDQESGEILSINREERKAFATVNAFTKQDAKVYERSKVATEWYKFYKIMEGETDHNCPKLKNGFHFQLQQYLRGADDGILKNIDPLLPIDFELDVDGIAGIFPGNSFQSSYLPQRYKNESLFQAVGVSHKIDSSGWTTTIKGQIRAVSQVVDSLQRAKAALEAYRKKHGITDDDKDEKDDKAPEAFVSGMSVNKKFQAESAKIVKEILEEKMYTIEEQQAVYAKQGLNLSAAQCEAISSENTERWAKDKFFEFGGDNNQQFFWGKDPNAAGIETAWLQRTVEGDDGYAKVQVFHKATGDWLPASDPRVGGDGG